MDNGNVALDIAPSGNDSPIAESETGRVESTSPVADSLTRTREGDGSLVPSYGGLTLGNLFGFTERKVILVTRDELLAQLRDDVSDLWSIVFCLLTVFFLAVFLRR
jgi:hypothetical protein